MEQEPKGPERGIELNQKDLEKRPEVASSPENSRESEAKRAQIVESARAKIEKQPTGERQEPAKEGGPKRTNTGLGRKLAYAETMASVQRHLPTMSRAFSKVIHNPAVEKTSEVAGATVLRPSVTLGATFTALLVGGTTYWLAKHNGYAVSGSTILLSLLVGGLFGLIVEGISKAFRPKH